MDALQRIRTIVEVKPIVLFMKGSPERPMCGFSAQAAECVAQTGVAFHAVDVLQDPELRANLPRFANWPTFPQLFVKGDLIGGADVIRDLLEQGALEAILSEAASAVAA